MARALPVSQPDPRASSQPGDWHALRGELVALLDQVEGQYAQAGTADPAFAGFAQRMRDLKYQMADVDPDDRHRQALRSVKRQVERFNERGEAEASADDVLQSAIQQIRARTQGAPSIRETVIPAAAALAQPTAPLRPPAGPRFDELANSIAGLSGRLGELEAELKLQRGNANQVREIADQVSQLSQVVELLAGAVGETGQVKRLESQISGLAQLIGQASKPDLSLLTDRLDQLSATVDRLADLQVQQIQFVVREAEFGPQAAAPGMQAIEAGVRSIYDRLDALEANLSVPPMHLERISAAMAEITARLGSDSGRPERLLGLVDAINGRINEIEDRGDALGGLKDDLEALRTAMLDALEPRFAAIETQLGQIDERLQSRGDAPGVAQIEAQIRQLVARMDQTGEQLSGLARLYSSERPAAPDFEALADLAATRTLARMPQAAAFPDLDRLADMLAARTAEVVAKAQAPAGLAEFEARITRLVESLARTGPPEDITGVADGVGRVEERLAALEASMHRRPSAQEAGATPVAPPVAAVMSASQKPVPGRPGEERVQDAMPRNPSAEAPLKEFGFPDLGPVRAALEAKNGPRKVNPGAKRNDEIEPRLDAQPSTPDIVAGNNRPVQSADGPPPDFDPARITRPPRPESSLDTVVVAPGKAGASPVAPTPPLPEVPASSRNTFIEAARRAAQRQNQSKVAQADTNSLIGRAFSRFQTGEGTTAKPAIGPAVAAVAPEPISTAPAAEKPSLLLRLTSKAGALKPTKTKAETTTGPILAPEAQEAQEAVPPQSFLLRHRRPILLAASLVAVSFMALNLVLQRMAEHEQPAPPV
ncbi:MAG TPA: hypothetical protein VL418_12980, partial [Devosiaceae bacterium]|nr:hypothetical protein [Devosiaceae bacterium]